MPNNFEMQTLIDLFTTDDWVTFDSTVSIEQIDFSIEGNNNALLVSFLEDGYIEKTFDVDVSKHDTILLLIPFMEFESKFEITFNNTTTFIFNTVKGKQYYQFSNVLENIENVRILSLQENKVMFRNLLVFKDDIPYDIGEGIKELVKGYVSESIFVGVASSNASGITIQGQPKYIEKYSVIEFNGEVHQIESYKTTPDSYEIKFTQLYDGRHVLSTFTNENVYLIIQVLNMPKDIEANNPCIVIEGGFSSEVMFFLENNSIEFIHTDSTGLHYPMKRLGHFKYNFTIHGVYRTLEIKHLVFNVLNKLQGFSKEIWINGKRHVVEFEKIIDQQEEMLGEIQMNLYLNYEVNQWMVPVQSLNESEVRVSIL